MTPLTLPSLKPLFLKPSLSPSPCPSQNPNPNSTSISLLSSPLSLSLRSSPSPSPSHSNSPVRCSVNYDGGFDHQNPQNVNVKYPRPEEIQWSLDLANSVRLIGSVGKPVEIKHLPSGSAVAWTRLGVYKTANETSWVNLQFWNELAHVAYQHLETGVQIFVSGRLVCDELNENDKTTSYYKVVVKELNLVQGRTPASPVSFYDPRMAQNSPVTVEKRWQAFFANPLEWWDNRNTKKNPNAPDFKHKDTGEALWLNSKFIPSWVNPQLEVLDSKMASMEDDDSRNSAVSFTDF